MTTSIIERVRELFPRMQETRRHIHSNPELSFMEFETSAYIQERLASLDIPFRVVATTGVVATIGSGDRCVALRADIDALPMQEETGLPYASTRPGVMHACGHDTHTTMLLTAAQVLKEREASLQGVVKLLFQPGEEKTPGGASLMIADGALESPRPEIIFGQHINPDAPAGEFSFVAGAMMASADELYFTVRGMAAHAAQPHKGKDPILAAAGLISHLQTLITKNRNPLDPGVITITSIHGGTATNIIPDTVELQGTLRAFDQVWRESAWKFIKEQSVAYCALHGCTCEVTILKGYPPLMNNEEATNFARSVASSIAENVVVSDFEPKMWAEDFSFYSQMMPAAFWMLGGRPSSVPSMPGLHNPKFAPEEESMINGAAMLAQTAVEYLRRR